MNTTENCQHIWQRTRKPAANGGFLVTDTCEICSDTATREVPPIDDKPKAEDPKVKNAIAETRYDIIESWLKVKSVGTRLALALGFNSDDQNGKTEAFKYISSVLMEIKKTETAPNEKDSKKLNKDLTFCTVDSIISAITDAASFRLPIDGRGLAHLVKYGDRASFMPGYRGYLYKIAENYRDVDFTAEPVFEGDELELSDDSGYQTYRHKRANPFMTDENKMTGLIACLAYTDNAGRHSKISTLAASEITQIRGAAKQDYIWKDWFFEKAKAAGLKRLCKIHFATIMGVQELARFDNEEHFAVEKLSSSHGVAPANPAEKLTSALNNNMLQHDATTVLHVKQGGATQYSLENLPFAEGQKNGETK